MTDPMMHQAHRIGLTTPHDKLFQLAKMAERTYASHPTAANWHNARLHRMAHTMSSHLVMGGFKNRNGFRGNVVKRHTPARALRAQAGM